MKQVVGKCGECGGRVTVETVYLSIVPPVPQCESCGVYVDDTAHLPILPMHPRRKEVDSKAWVSKKE